MSRPEAASALAHHLGDDAGRRERAAGAHRSAGTLAPGRRCVRRPTTATAVLVPPTSAPMRIRVTIRSRVKWKPSAGEHNSRTMPLPTASSVPSGTYQGQARRPTGASQVRPSGAMRRAKMTTTITTTVNATAPDYVAAARTGPSAGEDVGPEQGAVGDRGDRQGEDHDRRVVPAGGGMEEQRPADQCRAPRRADNMRPTRSRWTGSVRRSTKRRGRA